MFPLKEVLTPNKFNNAFVDFAVKDIRAFSIILVENNRTSITITEVAIILNFKIFFEKTLKIQFYFAVLNCCPTQGYAAKNERILLVEWGEWDGRRCGDSETQVSLRRGTPAINV